MRTKFKMLLGASGALAVTALTILAPAAAQAATAAYTWNSLQGDGNLWWNPNTAWFYSSHSDKTPLTLDVSDPDYQEIKLPNGDCMSWYKGDSDAPTNNVSAHACNDDSYELWALGGPFNGDYYITNEDASAFYGCPSVITSVDSGQEVHMMCWADDDTQEWAPTRS